MLGNLLGARTLRVNSEAIPPYLGIPALEPVRLAGEEGLNRLYAYELLLQTPDALNFVMSEAADFDLDAFIGKEVTCSIELAGSGLAAGGPRTREISGLVTDAQLWREEGRHAQYRLVLRPWLHLATLTTDCKIFQNKTVVDILDELLADYAFPVDKRLYETYPVRDYQTQFNESDFAFFERLCQEWGISYHFEHSDGKHRLVLADALAAYRPNPGEAYQRVDYYRPGWKADVEHVDAFVPHHRLTSGRYTSRDYDYTRPGADLTRGRADPRPTGHADGEVYQWHEARAGSHYAQPRAGSTGGNDPLDEGGRLALLRMQALRTEGARARAGGNLRGMVPGCTFHLQSHPRGRANAEYLVLDARLLIEDVGLESRRADGDAQWRVTVDFGVHPVTEPVRPEPTRAKPFTGGPQAALVVGPEGQDLWTDDLGRIKVQFPWDRIGRKNEHSTCWVRVSSPWAGNQLGGVQLPRIGQEVVVDFYGGDPDLPLCTGRVHNQMNLPPWSLPAHSALSGFRSRELRNGGGNASAGRSNHLVLDDTAGKIQAQLKSDLHCSSLSLGAITRVDDNAGRKDARGHGFELRTDAHGVVRARDGLLISTEERNDARGHSTDMAETIARLAHARGIHRNLAAAAQEAKAQEAGDQDGVTRALQVQNDAVRGAGKQADAASGEFPELDAPHLVVASSAGIGTTSTQGTHLHAGEHMAVTSGQHTSIAAGESFLASARRAVRLFAHGLGMRLVAYAGDIEIKALKSSISVLAQLKITQTAEEISIAASRQLVLNGGGSTIKLHTGGIEQATAGRHRVFAAAHAMVGPKNGTRPSLQGASTLADEPSENVATLQFELRAHPEDGRPMALEPYTLYRDGAEIAKGATDAQGRLFIENHRKGTRTYTVKLSNGHEFELPVVQQLGSPDEKLAARGYRAAQDDPQDRLRHFRQYQDDIARD